MLRPYSPEPLTDFNREENRDAFAAALMRVKAEVIGLNYPMIIDGQEVTTEATMPSLNPSRPAEGVAHFPVGDASHADRAVEAAARAFPAWSRVPVADRARYLLRAAAEMRRRKHEFSAVMVIEVGKS